MTDRIIDEAWNTAREARAARLAAEGLDLPEEEHASCGVGFVAAIDGNPRREVAANGLIALKAVWHRGKRAEVMARHGASANGAG